MSKTGLEITLNRKKMESGEFTLEDLPPYIQEQISGKPDIYVLKPGEWVTVGGYKVMLAKEAASDYMPSKIIIKYPPMGDYYWLKVIFASFLRRVVWVYDSCRVPFTDMFVARWQVGDSSSTRKYLTTFSKNSGSGPSTSG